MMIHLTPYAYSECLYEKTASTLNVDDHPVYNKHNNIVPINNAQVLLSRPSTRYTSRLPSYRRLCPKVMRGRLCLDHSGITAIKQ